MVPNYRNWTVWPWSRVESERQPPTSVTDDVRAGLWEELANRDDDDSVVVSAGLLRALLSDPEVQHVRGGHVVDQVRGVEYRATLQASDDGRTLLRTLEVTLRNPGESLDSAALRRVPVQTIAEVVAAQVAAEDRARGAQGTDNVAVILAPTPGALQGRGDPPTAEELARRWRATARTVTSDDGTVYTRRQWLAREYRVPLRTLDGWIRRARKAGHLPAATVGPHARKRSQTPGGDQPSGDHE